MAKSAKKKAATDHSESAVLVMSDLHYGKRTSSFNPDVFKEKLAAIGEKAIHLKEKMAGYEFDELVVPILGDVNDGMDIYPTQAHHQAISNVDQQAEELSDILVPWFQRQEEVWGKVRIECVPGNHGRVGKFAHEAANWDLVTYKYLKHKLKAAGSKINVGYNHKNNVFIRKFQIRKHNYLMYHGHDIKSFGNIPWYGMLLRTARWNTTHLAPFDVIMMGHFHTSGFWQFNKITALLNGTMVTDDDWALQTLGWESANKWWFYGVSNDRPITWQFNLDCNDTGSV